MNTRSLNAAASDANAQLRDLRHQVDQLMRDRVSPVVSDVAGRAQDYARQARGYAHDGADAFSGQVREMPIIAVLVSAAAGYLLGRLSR